VRIVLITDGSRYSLKISNLSPSIALIYEINGAFVIFNVNAVPQSDLFQWTSSFESSELSQIFGLHMRDIIEIMGYKVLSVESQPHPIVLFAACIDWFSQAESEWWNPTVNEKLCSLTYMKHTVEEAICINTQEGIAVGAHEELTLPLEPLQAESQGGHLSSSSSTIVISLKLHINVSSKSYLVRASYLVDGSTIYEFFRQPSVSNKAVRIILEAVGINTRQSSAFHVATIDLACEPNAFH